MELQTLALLALASVATGAVIAGLGVRLLSPRVVSVITILGVIVATAASLMLSVMYLEDPQPQSFTLYRWGPQGYGLDIAFLLDSLSILMMVIVSSVSLLVHIYSIGYMRGDEGYVRFFCYLSLFTFAMLLLVMANNFLLLFIGWEGVGLVSYLLIGFWFTRPRAPSAGLKAFLVNRLGDFGFLLGMGVLLAAAGSLDYAEVFAQSAALDQQSAPMMGLSVLSLACLLLFLGAMGKSAQVPLHVWLPDSMEGPTPISAMIHAATMVTAGIFMVARLSPLFEGSETALNLMLLVGGITALSMGLLGLVSYDIKRVIAYSTLSQLGYMTMALGASAYAASLYHLFTHAFFKALLFLAAGAVILAMHHEQDIRRMGGLWRRLPITTFSFAVGSLALVGMPGFAGFFSKEAIIEALGHSDMEMATVAYVMAVLGVAITALYSVRLGYYVFAGEPRSDAVLEAREPGLSVTLPLLALAALTLISAFGVEAFLYGGLLQDALTVFPQHDVLAGMAPHWQGMFAAMRHGVTTIPILVLIVALAAGIGVCVLYAKKLAQEAPPPGLLRGILEHKYGFDIVYERWVVKAALALAGGLARHGDVRLIDGALVNGVARMVRGLGAWVRPIQSGQVSHYALAMFVGLITALGYLLLGR